MAGMLLEMAIKQGTATVLAGLLLWAFWTVVLEPGIAERKLYSETITQSSAVTATATEEQAKSTRSIAISNEGIQQSMVAQFEILQAMKEELENQSEMRSVAMETMSAFANKVRDEHPQQLDLLDQIKKNTDEIRETVNGNINPE